METRKGKDDLRLRRTGEDLCSRKMKNSCGITYTAFMKSENPHIFWGKRVIQEQVELRLEALIELSGWPPNG